MTKYFVNNRQIKLFNNDDKSAMKSSAFWDFANTDILQGAAQRIRPP